MPKSNVISNRPYPYKDEQTLKICNTFFPASYVFYAHRTKKNRFDDAVRRIAGHLFPRSKWIFAQCGLRSEVKLVAESISREKQFIWLSTGPIAWQRNTLNQTTQTNPIVLYINKESVDFGTCQTNICSANCCRNKQRENVEKKKNNNEIQIRVTLNR